MPFTLRVLRYSPESNTAIAVQQVAGALPELTNERSAKKSCPAWPELAFRASLERNTQNVSIAKIALSDSRAQ